MKEKVLQPPSSASSANASLVPDVGGGPRTSIFLFGKDGSTSDHFLFGFAISLPSGPGTVFRALGIFAFALVTTS